LAVLLIAFAVVGGAQATFITVTDITGDSATHPLATSGNARWVQIIAGSGNGSVVRVGDSSTSATRGLPLAPGGGLFLPVLPGGLNYKLSAIYYYAVSGDSLSVMWCNQ
jgi:hypothetical protein